MIHEIEYRQPKQIIEKEGEPKFIGESTAKCMRTWIQGRITICIKRNLVQEEFFFRQVLNAYNHYHPI